MGCSTVFATHLQIRSNLTTLVLCTVFSSTLPPNCTPHVALGSLLTSQVLRSHLGPSPRPLSRFLGRDKNVCPLSETGSSASQNIASVDLVGVIHLSGVHVFTCISIKAGRRSNASDHIIVIKKGKWNLPAAYLSQEMKRMSSCSTQEQGCATLNTFGGSG